jgi:hypothetical protein
MQAPEITFYISLVTPEPAEKSVLRDWNSTVRKKAPYGVPTILSISDDKGKPQSVGLVLRETDKGNHHIVPLTRDLTEKEAERIIEAFRDTNPDLDFDVEATVIPTYTMDKAQPSITVDQQEYADVAKAFAKKQHEDWVKERTEQGWRYGPNVSLSDKTHPLLRPWDALPEQYRRVDADQPQKLLDLLAQHGYVVVSKEDLEAVQRLLRKVS